MSEPPVELTDACLECILSFVSDPTARLCCSAWSNYLYDALQLEYRIRFQKKLCERAASPYPTLPYHHSTVRDYGGMEECLSFTFAFCRDGSYSLHWFKEGLTSDNEQQHGFWRVVGDAVLCETLPPVQAPDIHQLRFAEPGRIFEVPVDAVLAGTTTSDGQLAGWELAARGLRADTSVSITAPLTEPPAPEANLADLTRLAQLLPRADARFVEVDGEMHQVSNDIVENWPEADWARLMRCRLRFGTGVERWH